MGAAEAFPTFLKAPPPADFLTTELRFLRIHPAQGPHPIRPIHIDGNVLDDPRTSASLMCQTTHSWRILASPVKATSQSSPGFLSRHPPHGTGTSLSRAPGADHRGEDGVLAQALALVDWHARSQGPLRPEWGGIPPRVFLVWIGEQATRVIRDLLLRRGVSRPLSPRPLLLIQACNPPRGRLTSDG